MDANGQAQNDMHTLAQGRAMAEQHELESGIVEEHELESEIVEEHELEDDLVEAHELEDDLVEAHEPEDDLVEAHELRSQITEEHELESESSEQNEIEAELCEGQGLVAHGFGIADVLFPASPPAPVNARVIRLFSADDERKPRGLASAAGLFGVRKTNPYDWRS